MDDVAGESEDDSGVEAPVEPDRGRRDMGRREAG